MTLDGSTAGHGHGTSTLKSWLGANANLRITHINSYDSAGGAARAAYRLHAGLLSLGQESVLLVQHRNTDDNTVLLFGPPLDVPTRFRRIIKRRLLPCSRKPLPSRPAECTYMSDDRSEHDGDV